jgi:hypothetical protein
MLENPEWSIPLECPPNGSSGLCGPPLEMCSFLIPIAPSADHVATREYDPLVICESPLKYSNNSGQERICLSVRSKMERS